MASLAEIVDLAVARASAADRPDLRRRLELTRRRLVEPDTRVMVVGEFKQGKSRLVNGLVNAPVCRVDDDVATMVPTVVAYGAQTEATLLIAGEGGSTEVTERHVTLPELTEAVSTAAAGEGERLIAGQVRVARKLLSGGLSIIDTPGMGGLNSAKALATLSALPSADAMLFVSDASQEFTAPELQFLKHALSVTPHVAVVITKADLYPHADQVERLDRERLRELAPGIPVFVVSSELREAALRGNDAELNAESGFPALLTYLRTSILARATALQNRSVTHDVSAVIEHLTLAVESELSALTDPATTPEVVAELETAKERNDELRRRSARWQLALSDGMSDLMSDVEYDLRDRMRLIQKEAEDAIDDGDPAPIWDRFIDWLEGRIAEATAETFVWTQERSVWLAEQVAEQFGEEDLPLPHLQSDDTADLLDPVEIVPDLDPGTQSALQKLLIGMRGSYGGVLMVGLVTGLAGLSLINPISLAAGVLIGRKAFLEDKAARLKHRQQEGKTLVRRQLDDVVFHVGKQLRDRLRVVQRGIRDHFGVIADEHHRSLADSLAAAQKAARMFAQEKEKRIRELRAELRRLQDLHSQLPQVEAPPPAPQMIKAAS